MKHIIILVITTIFFASCGNNEKPKVTYPENKDNKTAELKKDSTLVEIADLPIHIDSTKYLIHPIGEYNIYGRGNYSGSFSSSSGSGSAGFSISNYNSYKITGNLLNLKFQNVDSVKLKTLTDKNIRITSISFLRKIFKNTKKQILVYNVFDKDSNRDNKLDKNDIEALYISNINGANFKKLTSEFQELIDWKIIEVKNRLYFRSIEDTNKNGEFDKEDKVHYQYVDFNNDKLKVNEYKPI